MHKSLRRALVLASVLVILALIALVPFHTVIADCSPDGTSGNDSIICASDDSNGVNGGAGNDTITVDEGVQVDPSGGPLPIAINGGAGSDTIVNNGVVNGSMTGGLTNESDTVINNGQAIIVNGGPGNDTVINNGQAIAVLGGVLPALPGPVPVDGNDTITNAGDALLVSGGPGDDQITNSGNALFISGDEGNDTVTVTSGQVDMLDGGDDFDTLVFDWETEDQEALNAWEAALASASAALGSATWGSNTYNWMNFEALVNRVRLQQARDGIIVLPVETFALSGPGSTAPLAWLLNAGHGPRWVRLSDMRLPDGTALRVMCLDSSGNWTDANISGTALVEGGLKLYFFIRQDGLCATFPG